MAQATFIYILLSICMIIAIIENRAILHYTRANKTSVDLTLRESERKWGEENIHVSAGGFHVLQIMLKKKKKGILNECKSAIYPTSLFI